jgi:long-chain acyl-CoA synthetase
MTLPLMAIKGASVESLQELAANTLRREPLGQILEFEGRWYSWGELQNVATRMSGLLAASGIARNAPVCLISHNHPAVVAALLGLIAAGRTIRMVYPFQAPAGVARDIQRLQPAAFVLLAKDLSPEVVEALREAGVATIVLTGMDVSAAPGLAIAGPEAAARTFSGEPQIEVLTSGTTGPPSTTWAVV